MNARDHKVNRALARKEMPLRAGRPGGPHKDKSRYTRKTKHKDKRYE